MNLYECQIKIFNQLPNIGVIVTDVDGNIKYVNQAVMRQTQYDRNELLENKPSLLKSGMHSEKFYKKLWEIILSGGIFESEICNIRKDRTYYWQKTTIIPFVNGETEKYFIAFLLDITQSRQDELKLQAILESSPDIIAIYDLDKMMCIDVYSDFSANIYPNLKEFKGKSIEELYSSYSEEEYDKILKSFEAVKNNPNKVQVTEHKIVVNMKSEEGNVLSVERTMEAFYKKFNHNKCIVTVRDITDSRELLLYRNLKEEFSKLQKNLELLNRGI